MEDEGRRVKRRADNAEYPRFGRHEVKKKLWKQSANDLDIGVKERRREASKAVQDQETRRMLMFVYRQKKWF